MVENICADLGEHVSIVYFCIGDVRTCRANEIMSGCTVGRASWHVAVDSQNMSALSPGRVILDSMLQPCYVAMRGTVASCYTHPNSNHICGGLPTAPAAGGAGNPACVAYSLGLTVDHFPVAIRIDIPRCYDKK